MRFRALDDNGDFVFGSGVQAYAVDNHAIALNIETTLRTFLSECFFNPTLGIDWFQLLGNKNQAALLLSIKGAISNCNGVTAVRDLKYSLDKNRELSLTYMVDTIYTTQVVGTVTV